jgi:hypothetical protein
MALRGVLQATNEQIETMQPMGFDITIATRRYIELPIKEFCFDAGHFMRLARDPAFKGYMIAPTTCNEPNCPMYNGGKWLFSFHMYGEPHKREWTFVSDEHKIDTMCGDHSWLQGRSS